MKWFDTEEVKNKENLSRGQIDYLEKPSITVFGPFNILVRRQWDILVGWIALSVFFSWRENMSIASIDYVGLAVLIWLLYFAIVHGRRLAWNRNRWIDFDDFKNSESKWAPWGWIFFVLMLFQVLTAI